jgi:hypothetical protein
LSFSINLLSVQPQLLAAVKFVAHLVNQQVAHEIIALELLTVLLENPTDDSVEVAVGFVTECGSILQDLSPKGLHGGYAVGIMNCIFFYKALFIFIDQWYSPIKWHCGRSCVIAYQGEKKEKKNQLECP